MSLVVQKENLVNINGGILVKLGKLIGIAKPVELLFRRNLCLTHYGVLMENILNTLGGSYK